MIANYASCNFLITLKRTILKSNAWSPEYFLNLHPFFSWQLPGTGPAAAVMCPKHWKGYGISSYSTPSYSWILGLHCTLSWPKSYAVLRWQVMAAVLFKGFMNRGWDSSVGGATDLSSEGHRLDPSQEQWETFLFHWTFCTDSYSLSIPLSCYCSGT